VVKGFNGLEDVGVRGYMGWGIFELRDLGIQDYRVRV
jgi:hypothetical protein